jgi:hypothetical protein
MSARRNRITRSRADYPTAEFANTKIRPSSPAASASASALRIELSSRNLMLAEKVPHESTIGEIPSILYQDTGGLHGNFLPPSYRRICAAPDWQRRLNKHYTASSRVARSGDRVRRELDCANSSDALLMNIFCYPGITSRKPVCQLLGVEPGVRPQFGVRTRTPCVDGLSDRTEIDMLLGHLLVEAKLTEGDFQIARRALVHRYVDFKQVFDSDKLPASKDVYRHYQLIRGVLAAYHSTRSFLVLCDARRADLAEDWFRVVRAVRSCELRSRLAILTWQELAVTLPPKLQQFLACKYGIHATA